MPCQSAGKTDHHLEKIIMENFASLPQADRVAFAQSLLQITQAALESDEAPATADIHSTLVVVSSLLEPAKTH